MCVSLSLSTCHHEVQAFYLVYTEAIVCSQCSIVTNSRPNKPIPVGNSFLNAKPPLPSSGSPSFSTWAGLGAHLCCLGGLPASAQTCHQLVPMSPAVKTHPTLARGSTLGRWFGCSHIHIGLGAGPMRLFNFVCRVTGNPTSLLLVWINVCILGMYAHHEYTEKIRGVIDIAISMHTHASDHPFHLSICPSIHPFIQSDPIPSHPIHPCIHPSIRASIYPRLYTSTYIYIYICTHAYVHICIKNINK